MSQTIHINDIVFNYSESSYNIRPSIYSHKPNETFYLTTTEENLEIEKDDQISYKLNNFGHRSDDFVKLDSLKTNILFAGCSTTFGEGIKQKHRWTDRLYEELKNYHENLGNLNVLSYPGFGAETIIPNIFKYCKNFGLPQIIFILIPDIPRGLGFDEHRTDHFIPNIKVDYKNKKLKDDLSAEEMYGAFINILRMLDIFCEINNIKLFIGTWDTDTDLILQKSNLNSFVSVVSNFNEELASIKFFRLYDNLNKYDQKLAYDSRDGFHPGVLVHEYISDEFLRHYKDSLL